MAKSKSKEVSKVQPDLTLPEHLRDKPVEGVDQLKEVIRPPMLKIVQKQARDELLERFNKGDAIVTPAEALVASHNNGEPESFLFVPLFFYREWCTWTPIELRGQVPAILERTSDPTSELAAKSAVPDQRIEEIEHDGRKIKVRHVEHINYIVVLKDHELAFEPIIMGFSKGEYVTGTRFASMIKMRKASIYDCVFEARVSPEPRTNEKGSWFGFEIFNPVSGSPWSTVEEHEQLKGLYDDVKSYAERGAVVVDYEEEAETDVGAETAEAKNI